MRNSLIKYVKNGSIKIGLEGHPEDFNNLQELFKSGQLSKRLGIPVEDISLVVDEEKIESDEKFRLVKEIRTQGEVAMISNIAREIDPNPNGTLIILTCHCVYDPDLDCIYAEHKEDKPIYESDVRFAFNSLNWTNIENPLLVISGGKTKAEIDCSESRSYVRWAKKLNINFPKEKVAIEEYAMTSIENLLFSIYIYIEQKKSFPKDIIVISWGFKRERFEEASRAINQWQKFIKWQQENRNEFFQGIQKIIFMPVGDLWGIPKNRSIDTEKQEVKLLTKGLENYYQQPGVIQKIKDRDSHDTRKKAAKRYQSFPLPEPLEKLSSN